MPREAEARSWWADVDEVRERIERRRARESSPLAVSDMQSSVVKPLSPRRGVREVRDQTAPPRLSLVRSQRPAVAAPPPRIRPRPRPTERIGPRPDRIAAWAVVLGVLMLLAAILSSHG